MLRALFVGGLALGLAAAGCGEGGGAREVPVSKPRPAAGATDPGAATKPPRAIATH